MKSLSFYPFDWSEDSVVHNGIKKNEIQAWCISNEQKKVFVRVVDFPITCEMQLPEKLGYSTITWDANSIENFIKGYKKCLSDNIVRYNETFAVPNERKLKTMPTLLNYKLHSAREFYYYQPKEKPFVRLYFRTKDDMYAFINPIKLENAYEKTVYLEECKSQSCFNSPYFPLKIHEIGISATKKFLTAIKGSFTGWFESNDCTLVQNDKLAKEQYDEYIISCDKIKFMPENKTLPKARFMGFDIETYSDKEGEFPDELATSHVAYMISCVSENVGEPNTRRRVLLTIGDCPVKTENVEVRSFYNEQKMLMGFIDYINEDDPDVLTGYNTLKFDWKYLQIRLRKLTHPWFNPWSTCSRMKLLKSEKEMCSHDKHIYDCGKCSIAYYKKKEMISSGRGENIFYGVDIKGRLSMIDMIVIIMTDFKLPHYNLGFVSNYFIHEGKHEVTANEMFKIYAALIGARDEYNKNPSVLNGVKYEMAKSEYGRVGAYCIQDSELVNKLFVLHESWIWLCTQGGIYNVTPQNVYLYGQQKRGISLIYEECVQANIVMTERKPVVMKYKGGYVSEPLRGIHTAFCLDYNSLYPNAARRYNIDFTTLLPRMTTMTIAASYCHKRGIPYTFTCKECSAKQSIGENLFCKAHEDHIIKSLIESIPTHGELEHENVEIGIWDEEINIDNTPNVVEYNEKGHKKSQKKVVVTETRYNLFMFKKPYEREIFGKKVLERGIFPKLAARLIGERKAVREKQKGLAKDSLDFLMLEQRQLALKMVANSLYGFLGRKAGNFLFPEGAASITHFGRYNIKKLARHLETHYKEEGAKVVYGDSVTGDTPVLIRYNNHIKIERIDALVSHGWMTWHKDKECVDISSNRSDGVNNSEANCVEVWTEKGWTHVNKIIRHLVPKEKRIIEVTTARGSVKVTDEHSLLTPQAEKIKASDVIVGTPILHSSFPEPNKNKIHYASVAFFAFNYTDDFYTNDMMYAATLFLCLSFFGWKFDFTVEHNNSKGKYHFHKNTELTVKENKIVSIDEVEHDECYVYDLQTENHHFQAGIGQIIVHNTDSVMVELTNMKGKTDDEKENRRLLMSRKKEFETVANMINLDPMHAEFEKGMLMVLFNKKMYAYYKINDEGGFYMETFTEKINGKPVTKPLIRDKGYFIGKNMELMEKKGIPLARREDDFFKLDMYEAVLRKMMQGSYGNELKQVITDLSIRLLTQQCPIEDLTMISGVKSYYKQEGNKLKVFSDHRTAIGKRIVGGDRYNLVVMMPRNSDVRSEKIKVGYKLRGIDELADIKETEVIDHLYYIKKSKRVNEIYCLLFKDKIEKQMAEYDAKDQLWIKQSIAMSLILILGDERRFKPINQSMHKELFGMRHLVQSNPDSIIDFALTIPRCKGKVETITSVVKRRYETRCSVMLRETDKPIEQMYKLVEAKQTVMKDIIALGEDRKGIVKRSKYPLQLYVSGFTIYKSGKPVQMKPTMIFYKGAYYRL